MAKKKAAPKSTPAKKKPRTPADVTVELHLPDAVYAQYFPPHMEQPERSDEIRKLYDMIDGQLTKKGMKYCLIVNKTKSKSADADEARDRSKDPVKYCDEGGR
jgi:hypothetical protein